MELTYHSFDQMLEDLKAKSRGKYFICSCPACNQPEAFIYKEKPNIIKCNRNNHCGETTIVTFDKEVSDIPIISDTPGELSKVQEQELAWLTRLIDHVQINLPSPTLDPGYRGISSEVSKKFIADFANPKSVSYMFKNIFHLRKKDYSKMPQMVNRNLIIPIRDVTGQITSVVLRSSIKTLDIKEIFLPLDPKKNQNFISDIPLNTSTIVISESILDGLSFREIDPNVGLIMMTGASKTSQVEAFIRSDPFIFKDKTIILATDNDIAGVKAANKLSDCLDRYQIPHQRFKYPTEGIIDPSTNELIVVNDPNQLLQTDKELFLVRYRLTLQGGDDLDLKSLLDSIKSNNHLKDLDLSNLDLSNSNFSGKILENVKFDTINLKNAQFSNCEFKNCEFISCNLDGANFQNAVMELSKIEDSSLQATFFGNFTSKENEFDNPYLIKKFGGIQMDQNINDFNNDKEFNALNEKSFELQENYVDENQLSMDLPQSATREPGIYIVNMSMLEGNEKALATVQYGDAYLHNISVVTHNDIPFVNMPAEKGKDGAWRDVYTFTNDYQKKAIEGALTKNFYLMQAGVKDTVKFEKLSIDFDPTKVEPNLKFAREVNQNVVAQMNYGALQVKDVWLNTKEETQFVSLPSYFHKSKEAYVSFVNVTHDLRESIKSAFKDVIPKIQKDQQKESIADKISKAKEQSGNQVKVPDQKKQEPAL